MFPSMRRRNHFPKYSFSSLWFVAAPKYCVEVYPNIPSEEVDFACDDDDPWI